MSHFVVLDLDEFGSTAVAREARRLRLSPAELLARAARYYLAEEEIDRLALRVPRFVRPQRGVSANKLALEVDDAEWRGLEPESTRQCVAVERLLEHAVLYLLADLDSGRAATRILAD